MSQVGYTPISIYYSSTSTNVPLAANLVAGELAINTADGKLFYKDSSGVVQTIASKNAGTVPGANTQIIYNNSGALGASSNFVFDGTNVGIGTTTPAYLSNVASLCQIAVNRNPSTGAIVNTGLSAAFLNLDSASGGSSIQFATASANNTQPTERMRIDSSGNVGIGTSSPSSQYSTANQLVIGANSGNLGMTIAAGASSQGSIFFSKGTATDAQKAAGYIYYLNTSDYMAFGTANTERMRIDSSGNLLVGSSSSVAGKLQVTNSANVGTEQSIRSLLGTNNNNTTSYHLVATTGATDRAYIYGNGNIVNSNNSYGALSDQKLKENIVDATPKLDDLCKIKIRNYNLISDESKTKQIGVIAQELEEVFPSLIDESPDLDLDGNVLETTTKQVKYSVFVPMLIKAIQEQQAIINELKSRIETLENK